MSRLCEGRANTVRGAAHFLRETVGRVRYAGAQGRLTVRANSGFYTHAVVAVCRKTKVRFSITIRQGASLRNLIEAIPEADWTPIPYWMDGAADVAETAFTPFRSKPDAAPVRLIVRRVKPTPGSQLALFASYSYHGFITDRDGEMLEREADHRRHAEIGNAIRDLKYGVGLNHLPSGRFAAAGGTGDGPQHRPVDGAHRSGRAGGHHQDPPAAVLLPGGTNHPPGPPPHPASSPPLALGSPVQPRPGTAASGSTSCLTAMPVSEPSNGQPNVPANSRPPDPRGSLAASSPHHLALPNVRRRSQGLPAASEDRLRPLYPKSCPDHPFPCCNLIPSVDLGLGESVLWRSLGLSFCQPVSVARALPVVPVPAAPRICP